MGHPPILLVGNPLKALRSILDLTVNLVGSLGENDSIVLLMGKGRALTIGNANVLSEALRVVSVSNGVAVQNTVMMPSHLTQSKRATLGLLEVRRDVIDGRNEHVALTVDGFLVHRS